MKYSIKWLEEQVDKEVHLDYIFFWGHNPKRNDIVDKSCFSQWYDVGFILDDICYLSAEHWMMAAKARLFNDEEIYNKIILAKKPAIAKALGREVKNFDADLWNNNAYELVVKGNYYKFSQHPALRDFLIKTGKRIIVEASPVDNIWGIGLSQDDADAMNLLKWKGTNLLGFALMEVRDLINTENGK